MLTFRVAHTYDDFVVLCDYLPEMEYWSRYKCTSSSFKSGYFRDLESLLHKWCGWGGSPGCGSCVRYCLEECYVYYNYLKGIYGK